jgi:hypothetical protein
MKMKKIKHPLHQGKLYPITTVLRDLASQENCDGEPYDQMIEAADEIYRLERERDAAVAALKPFADFADPHNRAPDHLVITVGSSMARKQLTMGDCYKARQALKEKK